MKKFVILLTIVNLVIGAYCQESLNRQEMIDYFKQRSERQNKAGWIMLGGGTALTVGGLIGFDNSWDNGTATETDIYGFVVMAGVISGICSIPMFISAHQNKKKAISLSLSYQNTMLPKNDLYSLKNQRLPALTLRLNL